jgi:hypothetical protein
MRMGAVAAVGSGRRGGVSVCVLRVMEAMVSIVGGALGDVAEDVVGGAYSGEALAGRWVGAVAVWVVF